MKKYSLFTGKMEDVEETTTSANTEIEHQESKEVERPVKNQYSFAGDKYTKELGKYADHLESKIAQLEKDLDEAIKLTLSSDHKQQFDRIEELEKENELLSLTRKVLNKQLQSCKEYMIHKAECRIFGECNCGLEQLLKDAEAH